jgi:hypothetical protein
MKLFGINIRPKQKKANANAVTSANNAVVKMSPRSDIKQKIKQLLELAIKYQITIIVVAIVSLLSITALKMLNYADPSTDDVAVQENLKKFHQIHINQKAVDKIKALKESQASTGTNLESGRSNPFSEQ